MYNLDQLEYLRNIRLAFVHCSHYDDVPDATLQMLEFEPGIANCLVTLEVGSPHSGQDLKDLCMVTGCILYFYNRRMQPLPLTRMRGAVLRHLQDACSSTLSPNIACCYGVIASLLLQASGAHQAAKPWQKCIVAALAACIYLQLSGATCRPPPILMYSSSISASFTACVLEAQRVDEVCQLMQPLLHLLKHLCIPDASAGLAVPEAARAQLQGSMIPLVSLLARRLHQLRGLGHGNSKVSQSPQSRQEVSLWSMLTWQLQKEKVASAPVGIRACGHACTATSAAADAAQILAMAYHQPSRAHAPNLPQCISQVLQLVGDGPMPALLLAERIPVPSHLEYLQHSRNAWRDRMAQFSRGIHGADEEINEEVGVSIIKYIKSEICEYLLPSLSAPGHWSDAATFILTLLQSCMPHQRTARNICVLGGEDEELSWWNKFVRCLLPILAALMASCSASRKVAIEVAIAILSGCPDDCEDKRLLCLELAGVLVMSRADASGGQGLVAFMKGIALYCECPRTVLDVCWICTSQCCESGSTNKAHEAVIALVSVAVHGKLHLLPVVLRMAEKLMLRMDNKPVRVCLSEIRASLESCHDFRKKPHCVRWFHRQVQAIANL